MNNSNKKWYIIAGAIIALILIFYPWDSCGGKILKEETKVTIKDTTVTIPEVIGGFESPKNFDQNPGVPDTVYVTKKVYIQTQNPVDKKLVEDYKKEKDTVQKLRKYVSAIEERSYTTDYSNEKLELSVETKVRGELLYQKPEYKIKETKAVVEIKTVEKTITKEVKDNFGILATGGYNKSLSADLKDSFEVGGGVRIGNVSILVKANTNMQVGGSAIIEF